MKQFDMNKMIEKIVEILDYALDKSESDELLLRFEMEGANWVEDEEEDLAYQYPPQLSDPCLLAGGEFGTCDEIGYPELIDRFELEQLRDLLKGKSP